MILFYSKGVRNFNKNNPVNEIVKFALEHISGIWYICNVDGDVLMDSVTAKKIKWNS